MGPVDRIRKKDNRIAKVNGSREVWLKEVEICS